MAGDPGWARLRSAPHAPDQLAPAMRGRHAERRPPLLLRIAKVLLAVAAAFVYVVVGTAAGLFLLAYLLLGRT